MRAYSLRCEEGKEKEKMLLFFFSFSFFSAVRAVVHLEKAISEPAITRQKESDRKREREKEVSLAHELRERVKERKRSDHKNKWERETQRASERKKGHDDEQKHTRHPWTGDQIIVSISLTEKERERVRCFIERVFLSRINQKLCNRYLLALHHSWKTWKFCPARPPRLCPSHQPRRMILTIRHYY